MAPTEHDCLYFEDGNVVFFVEETLFNVYRSFLKRESSVFRDMFCMESDEGHTNDKPILLEDTSSVGFGCLLGCLFPSTVGEVDYLLPEKWALVVDLAIRWQFHSILDLAVNQMTDIQINSSSLAVQLATARRHEMNEWYWGAFLKLCERGPPTSPKEGKQIDILETVQVSAVRQKLHRRNDGEREGTVCSIHDAMTDIKITPDQQKDIRKELGLPPLPQLPSRIPVTERDWSSLRALTLPSMYD